MPDDPTPAPEPKPRKPKPEPVNADAFNKVLEELLKKNGGDHAAGIQELIADRDALRDEIASLKAKTPKEGSVVLDAETAKAWAAYQAMGEPGALAKQLEDGKAAATERDGLKFDAHIGEVAGLEKWKKGVLADRVKASGIETTILEQPDPRDSKAPKVRVPHVKLEGDKVQPLTEYATAHWGDYLPALQLEQPKPAPAFGTPPTNGHTPPRPAIVDTNRPVRSLVR